MSEMLKFTVRLTPEDHRRLDKMAQHNGESQAELVRNLIRASWDAYTRMDLVQNGPALVSADQPRRRGLLRRLVRCVGRHSR